MEAAPSSQYWLYLLLYFAIMIIPSAIAVIFVIRTPRDRIRRIEFLNVDFKIFWAVIAIMGLFVGAVLTLFLARTPVPPYEKDAMKREAVEKKALDQGRSEKD